MGNQENRKGFQEAIDDHSVEGLEILQAPAHFIAHAALYLILSFIILIISWSFFAKANVMVKAQGRVAVQDGARQVYCPANGALVEVFVSEGVHVSEGDVIARVKSSQAIQIASGATKAKLALENEELARQSFPKKKQLMLREIEGMERTIEFTRKQYDQQKNQGMQKMSEAQKSQLRSMRMDVLLKQKANEKAEELFGKYKELYDSPGHGGIARNKLMEKETEFLNAESEYKKVLTGLENLEYAFAKQYLASSQKLEGLHMQLLNIELQYEKKKREISQSEKGVEMKYLGALKEWEAASRVSYDDLDENNFLSIRSPVSGEIAKVTYTQIGEQVSSTKPLVTISPEGAPKIMEVFVKDQDRGLLKAGQDVKLKFKAFSYQRYGFLTGKLQYISNNAQQGKDGAVLYRGSASLNKDYFESNGKRLPVRFGMTATVEIVVQKRRLIDFAIDPFRKLVK
jgi:hemolysin D